jgi:type II secretory pathway pseudopilin PulG
MTEAIMVHGDLVRRRGQQGFTYVAMLFALAIVGVGLAALGESWSSVTHRDKEDELIDIVSEYMASINRYYVRSPGTPKAFPLRLEDLLEDHRFAGTIRHLRRLYRDPMTGKPEWGLIRNASGGIVGIYSLSDRDSLRKRGAFVDGALPVAGTHYSEWKFISSLPEAVPDTKSVQSPTTSQPPHQ